FEGALVDTLRDPIARARAALRAVSADALVRISQIAFDRPAIEPYLSCTPEPALALTRRLLSGISPRDLVLEGQADPKLLEIVLSDLARRGAIHSVEREAGASLFPPAAISRPSPSRPGDEDLDWEEELSEGDVAPASAAPAQASVEPAQASAVPSSGS